MNSYITTNITVKISDPWESLQWKPLKGKAVSTKGEVALIQLINSFEFKNITCEFFVVSPRHEGDTLLNLKEGKLLFCGMTRIEPEQYQVDTCTIFSGIHIV